MLFRSLQWGLLLALALRIGAAVAGLREGFAFEDAFRLASYTLGFWSGYIPASLLSAVSMELGGLAWLASVPVVLGMQVSAMQAHFAVRHRLSRLAALGVALTPLMLVVGVVGLIVVLAIYQRTTR